MSLSATFGLNARGGASEAPRRHSSTSIPAQWGRINSCRAVVYDHVLPYRVRRPRRFSSAAKYVVPLPSRTARKPSRIALAAGSSRTGLPCASSFHPKGTLRPWSYAPASRDCSLALRIRSEFNSDSLRAMAPCMRAAKRPSGLVRSNPLPWTLNVGTDSGDNWQASM